MNENIEEFACRRKTVSWPVVGFCNRIDAASNNAFLLMQKIGVQLTKKQFLKQVSIELARPYYAKMRLQRLCLHRHIIEAAKSVGYNVPAPEVRN